MLMSECFIRRHTVTDDWPKQLSDAGFPQSDSAAGHVQHSGNAAAGASSHKPTLSELIAACPKQIGTATFLLGSGQGGTRWTATYFDFRTNRMVDDDALCQSGDTPEEAVAKLWLATQ